MTNEERLALIKKVAEKRNNKLTKAVKKAKHLSAGQLECFSEENMYYSDRETQDYLRGSSIMDNYRGTNDWD